ncbi:MAG: hypothetical protein IKU68_03020 [Oscillospiraceae bacterium]|nr:hypothetical protein [Oscillospiraceae bacterium]
MSFSANQIRVGDRFLFGRYAPAGEMESTPVSWVVLAMEEGRMLVMAEKILDMQPYHNTETPVRWENSSLCRWLNDHFLNSAFTDAERQQIWKPDHMEDPMGDLLWEMFGMETVTAHIQNQVFLLNYTDLDTYFPHEDLFYTGVSALGTEAVEKIDGSDLCWWLRSSMHGAPFAYIVSPCDSVGVSRIDGSNRNGVRPAMWLRLEP